MTTINDFKLITQVVSPSAEDEFFDSLDFDEITPMRAKRVEVTKIYHLPSGRTVTRVVTVISSVGINHTVNIIITKGNNK